MPKSTAALELTAFQNHVLDPAVQVYLPYNLTVSEFLQLAHGTSPGNSEPAFIFPALQNWLIRLFNTFALQENEQHPYHRHPYKLRDINVQAVDWFWKNEKTGDGRLGFMKIQTTIETDPYLHENEQELRADWLPGAVFLRGGSVGMLIIVQPEDATHEHEKHVIFTVQPRIAAASLAFTEIPAGMLDGNSFKGTAANEIQEEAHLVVQESDLINMSELALQNSPSNNSQLSSSEVRHEAEQHHESLESAMYPSVGACDEFIPLFLCQKRLTTRHMEWLKGRATGLRDEGENITLKLVPLNEAWREGARDAKALAALALYEGLKREGRIPSMPEQVEEEPKDLR